MAASELSDLCPDESFAALLEAIQSDEQSGLFELQQLMTVHKDDARLHFLSGSLLASQGDFKAARAAMRLAVDLAPGFEIARFQLGFLHLTSGEDILAQEAWGPLHSLPENHFLQLFVRGLSLMTREDLAGAARLLEEGIRQNSENEPLNRDMNLILEEIRNRSDISGEDAPFSSAHLLLQQSAFKGTRH